MYNLIFSREAENNFSSLSKDERKKVVRKLEVLKNNPYLGKKLNGELAGQYSFRAWPYRILYQIYQKQLVITVLKIAHRQGVYK